MADIATQPLDPKTFKIRAWRVTVCGFSEPMSDVVLAATRGKALSQTWGCDAFEGYTYKQFLKIARCRLEPLQPKPVEISFEGKPCWFVDKNNAYVRFVWPDTDQILSAHPYDILPISVRPLSYQDRRDA